MTDVGDGSIQTYELCKNISINATAYSKFTVLSPGYPENYTEDSCLLFVDQLSYNVLIDVLNSMFQLANCRQLPFDIQDSITSQSLLEDYGQASCPVYMNNREYHIWTGVWNQSQFVYFNLTKAQNGGAAFSLNVTSKYSSNIAFFSCIDMLITICNYIRVT